MSLADHDGRVRRCPLLGHELAFSYCRQPAQSSPCHRLLDCWWETFDVVGFVRAHYPEDIVERTLAPRPPKVATLLALIEQARQRCQG